MGVPGGNGGEMGRLRGARGAVEIPKKIENHNSMLTINERMGDAMIERPRQRDSDGDGRLIVDFPHSERVSHTLSLP